MHIEIHNPTNDQLNSILNALPHGTTVRVMRKGEPAKVMHMPAMQIGKTYAQSLKATAEELTGAPGVSFEERPMVYGGAAGGGKTKTMREEIEKAAAHGRECAVMRHVDTCSTAPVDEDAIYGFPARIREHIRMGDVYDIENQYRSKIKELTERLNHADRNYLELAEVHQIVKKDLERCKGGETNLTKQRDHFQKAYNEAFAEGNRLRTVIINRSKIGLTHQHSLGEMIERMIHEIENERAGRDSACKSMAEVWHAATGTPMGAGPAVGIIEDVVKIREERDRFRDHNKAIHSRIIEIASQFSAARHNDAMISLGYIHDALLAMQKSTQSGTVTLKAQIDGSLVKAEMEKAVGASWEIVKPDGSKFTIYGSREALNWMRGNVEEGAKLMAEVGYDYGKGSNIVSFRKVIADFKVYRSEVERLGKIAHDIQEIVNGVDEPIIDKSDLVSCVNWLANELAMAKHMQGTAIQEASKVQSEINSIARIRSLILAMGPSEEGLASMPITEAIAIIIDKAKKYECGIPKITNATDNQIGEYLRDNPDLIVKLLADIDPERLKRILG